MLALIDVANLTGVVTAVVAVLAAIIAGAPAVRKVRRDTGDRSWVTAVLGGDIFKHTN